MCELFGINGKNKKRIDKELKEFFTHADKNPHGWGLALFDTKSGKASIEREYRSADKSERVNKLLSDGIDAYTAIAHIRLATIGLESQVNTHPFSGLDASDRRWTLAHNGTIFECDALNRYTYEQDGDTDSERILLYILDRMSEAVTDGIELDDKTRFCILDEIITGISPQNKLNLIIFDGDLMYVHTNCRNTLFCKHDGGSIYFSTHPIGNGDWENIPFTRLMAYKDGDIAFYGTDHGNEYIPDEKSIQALYLAYSGL